MLWNQAGWVSAPPLLPKISRLPSDWAKKSVGTVRTTPDFAPLVVSRMSEPPSKGPPTLPPFCRNSCMTGRL